VFGDQHRVDTDSLGRTQQAAEVLWILEAVQGEQQRRLESPDRGVDSNVGIRIRFRNDPLVVCATDLVQTVALDCLDRNALHTRLVSQCVKTVGAASDQYAPDGAPTGAQGFEYRVAAVQVIHNGSRAAIDGEDVPRVN
jgi:hypothetical protein